MAVEECYANSGHIDELMDGIEQKMFAATQKRVSDKTVPARQIVPEAMAIINTMVSRKGEMTGLRSGFADLDCLTWGFQKSDLIIIAARPSQGKTALALNIAEAMIYPQSGKGVGVLIFSLEMSGTQLMQRMICSRARVNMKLLRDGLVSKTGDDLLRMKNAADDIARAGLFIDDTSAIPVSHIRARARRVHARNPLGCIIVDYLQLMAPTNASTPREQQVAEASRGLKALAKELNVPVIVLSQLNRSSEKDNRPPRLSDLRESGSIEQDADVVLMLSRPKDADDRYQTAADSMDLVVAKQRNGPVGTLKLSFLRDITRFENYRQ
jgi:replicative DNA helicase